MVANKNIYFSSFKLIQLLWLISLLLLSTSTFASGVSLNATRIVYTQNEKSVSIGARNNTDANYLAKFFIVDEAGNKTVPFTLSPPLAKIQSRSNQEVRIYAQPSNLPTDRESIYYFHAVMIPSTDGPLASNALSIAYDHIIKLFYRPQHLPMTPEKARESLSFKANENGVTVINDSPYYISLSSLVLNGTKVNLNIANKNTMISPYQSFDYLVPAQARKGTAEWITINDLGGEDAFKTNIK